MVWSTQKIISEINELVTLGQSLNAQNAKTNYGSVYNAACKKRYFGSWRSAVEAAGFDYNAIKKETKRKAALKCTKWTKEIIIQKIIELYKNGESLANSKVRIKYATLRMAARDKFGSWKNAIEAAGLNYDKINLRANEEKWNKKKVTNRILLIYQEGGDISNTHLRKVNNSLLKAGINHFGNWRKAVESTGIVYDTILKCVPYKWNKSKVIEELRRVHNLGEELSDDNISKNRNALYNAGRKYFGNWKSAVEATGFDYTQIRHYQQQYWSKEKIVKSILQLNKKGVDLNDNEIARTNGALRSIACSRRYFGSWRNAIEAAGFNYKDICKDLNNEARKGFLFEKYCEQIFGLLNPKLKRQTKPVVSNCIPDFIAEDSGKWVEVKLNCRGKGVKETITKYLQYVDKLEIIYLFGRKPEARLGVTFTHIDEVYHKLKFIGRQDIIKDLNLLKKGIVPTKHRKKYTIQ